MHAILKQKNVAVWVSPDVRLSITISQTLVWSFIKYYFLEDFQDY